MIENKFKFAEIGQKAAASLFKERVIFAMDPGFINTVGIIAAKDRFSENGDYEGFFKKHLVSSKGRFAESGVNAFIQARNSGAEETKARRKARIQRQRYWSNFVNNLFALAESMNDGAMMLMPMILFGASEFSTMKGQRSTNPKWIIDYLKRFFVVLVIDESKLSKMFE